MISDDYLYQLAIFLGSCAMLLIVLYHFLEVNAKDSDSAKSATAAKTATQSFSKQSAGTTSKAPGSGGKGGGNEK